MRSDRLRARCAESLQKSLRLDGVVGPSLRRAAASSARAEHPQRACKILWWRASGCEQLCRSEALRQRSATRVAPGRRGAARGLSFAFHFNSARASACKTLASRENEACGVQEYTRGSDAIHYVRNGSRDLCDLFYAHNRPRPRASHITTITASSITTMTRFVILVAVATAHEISSTPARARVRIPRIN